MFNKILRRQAYYCEESIIKRRLHKWECRGFTTRSNKKARLVFARKHLKEPALVRLAEAAVLSKHSYIHENDVKQEGNVHDAQQSHDLYKVFLTRI